MGCFRVFFGTCKQTKGCHRGLKSSLFKDQRHVKWQQTLQSTKAIKVSRFDKLIKPISESKEKSEDQLNICHRKKVKFDSNVKTHEVSIQEVANCSVENEKEKESEKEVKEIIGNQELEGENLQEREREEEEEEKNHSKALSDSSTSSMISYPPMHRYHNCSTSDNESIDMELEDFDDHVLVEEESSESLFSLSIDSRKPSDAADMDDKEVNSLVTIELNQNGRDRNRTQFVHSVLNPVENLTQWKAIKSPATSPLKDEEKENVNLDQELNILPISEESSLKKSNPNSKQNSGNLKPEDCEFTVDTSLSSWLVESEKTPIIKESPNSIGDTSSQRENSSRKFEGGPILGALTVQELKQHSVSSSPRRSPRRGNPDEMPIIGTVGSYLSRTGQIIGSSDSSSSRNRKPTKFREDKREKCHSTPFVTRLNRALDKEVA